MSRHLYYIHYYDGTVIHVHDQSIGRGVDSGAERAAILDELRTAIDRELNDTIDVTPFGTAEQHLIRRHVHRCTFCGQPGNQNT